MNRSIGKRLAFLGSAFCAMGYQAPQSPVTIDNQTGCEMTLSFEQSLVAKLNLPDYIEPYGYGEGQIDFSYTMFETNQQTAMHQYVLNCDHKNYIVSFHFFAGIGDLSIHDYYFEAKTSDDAPFLIIPTGKVLIKDGHPVKIKLINKQEDNNEAITPDDDPHDPDDDPCEDLGDDSDSEHDAVQDKPDASDKKRSSQDNTERV